MVIGWIKAIQYAVVIGVVTFVFSFLGYQIYLIMKPMLDKFPYFKNKEKENENLNTIIVWILEAKEKGMSDDEAYSALKENGWPEKLIIKARLKLKGGKKHGRKPKLPEFTTTEPGIERGTNGTDNTREDSGTTKQRSVQDRAPGNVKGKKRYFT